ncbi:MAG: hypothetical protein H6621_10695 [Halobacteriovoraceae bacterium]|nr:hypothetical protein [Halobacteriovoraceae bacterium]MCB9095525.1 hypothetical protein [Halobacteriovoraceae bacterium]
MPTELYPSFYSLHASLGIILMDRFWCPLGGSTFYSLEGSSMVIMTVFYSLSWLLMFWSMYSTGLLKQSGIEDWWKGVMKKNLTNSIPYGGIYKYCRHPIYASFIAMVWTGPTMTFDHLFLSLSWTAYILIGARLKEKRLRRNKGYIQYSENVPSFPFLTNKFDKILVKYLWRLS